MESNNNDLTCPFCGEKEFDKPGLKYHLQNYCEEYAKTGNIEGLWRANHD